MHAILFSDFLKLVMQDCQRRRSWIFAIIAALTQPWASEAPAQGYPSKPVRLVVGFAPGGGTDVTSRLLAQKLSAELGQSVVVENRPGASGSIAAEYVAKSIADGHTLLMIASATVASAALRADLPFDLERDFAPVSLVTTAPLVLLLHPSVPARDVKELIALARARPGTITYGSDGIGSGSHLAGELFSFMTNVKLVHVPFKGGSESTVATASGQIQINFPSVPSALPLLKAGKLTALAVTTVRRSLLLPSIPTLHESGLSGYDFGTWYGLVAPAAVPKSIISQLNAALVKVVNTAEMKEFINKQGMEPQANSPEHFGAFMRAQTAQVARLGKLSGLKIE
jgi:tripartite-type tricarboxylate transporter receptor subunit TctC